MYSLRSPCAQFTLVFGVAYNGGQGGLAALSNYRRPIRAYSQSLGALSTSQASATPLVANLPVRALPLRAPTTPGRFRPW